MTPLKRLAARLAARRPAPRLPLDGSTEPLLGWRAWQVVDGKDGPKLESWCHGTTWPARQELRSRCYVHGSRPAVEHFCGIHAFAERDDAVSYASSVDGRLLLFNRRPGDALGIAVGRVSCWGRIVRHSHGWRSQFAYPYDLFLLSGDQALARSLSRRYAVDVTAEPLIAT